MVPQQELLSGDGVGETPDPEGVVVSVELMVDPLGDEVVLALTVNLQQVAPVELAVILHREREVELGAGASILVTSPVRWQSLWRRFFRAV